MNHLEYVICGTCSRQITIDVDAVGIIRNLSFFGGCNGNLKGICALAIGKSAEGISRQPEAAGNIRTSLMLGLVFIETVVIYALIIAILVIFVL